MTKILNTTTLTFLQETTFIFYTIAFGWINKYRIYSSIFNKIKRAEKVKYYTEMLNTHKHYIKETLKIMRHAMRKQPGIMKLPQTFVMNGQEVSNSKYIAEQFNIFLLTSVNQSWTQSLIQ